MNGAPMLEIHPKTEAPLFSLEAEVSVLGGMFIDADARLRAMDLVEAGDFYREPHRILFSAMVDLQDRDVAVDVVTLGEALRRDGLYEKAGGAPYLSQLMDAVPTAANIEYHARIVREKAQLRRLGTIAATVDELTKSGRDAAEVQDEAERLVFAAGQGDVNAAPLVPVKSSLQSAMDKLENHEPDVLTGFTDLDHLTMGFGRGDLVILAARPSMGKTSLGVQIGVNVAAAEGDYPAEHKPGRRAVAVFSLEMPHAAISQRMLFTEAMIDGNSFRRDPKRHEFAQMAQAGAFLKSLPMYLHDRARTVREMRTHCRRLAMERKAAGDTPLGMIVIDYLGKVQGSGKTDNRVHELGEITGDLKRLAVELDVPVLLLCQLSRAVEARPDKRPIMSDLRDSGEIEQDADTVLFLYRPEYYFGPTDKDGNSLEGRAELIIGKARNGPTGLVPLYFRKECTRFESVTPREDS
jgi:replicative DNA helicase